MHRQHDTFKTKYICRSRLHSVLRFCGADERIKSIESLKYLNALGFSFVQSTDTFKTKYICGSRLHSVPRLCRVNERIKSIVSFLEVIIKMFKIDVLTSSCCPQLTEASLGFCLLHSSVVINTTRIRCSPVLPPVHQTALMVLCGKKPLEQNSERLFIYTESKRDNVSMSIPLRQVIAWILYRGNRGRPFN